MSFFGHIGSQPVKLTLDIEVQEAIFPNTKELSAGDSVALTIERKGKSVKSRIQPVTEQSLQASGRTKIAINEIMHFDFTLYRDPVKGSYQSKDAKLTVLISRAFELTPGASRRSVAEPIGSAFLQLHEFVDCLKKPVQIHLAKGGGVITAVVTVRPSNTRPVRRPPLPATSKKLVASPNSRVPAVEDRRSAARSSKTTDSERSQTTPRSRGDKSTSAATGSSGEKSSHQGAPKNTPSVSRAQESQALIDIVEINESVSKQNSRSPVKSISKGVHPVGKEWDTSPIRKVQPDEEDEHDLLDTSAVSMSAGFDDPFNGDSFAEFAQSHAAPDDSWAFDPIASPEKLSVWKQQSQPLQPMSHPQPSSNPLKRLVPPPKPPPKSYDPSAPSVAHAHTNMDGFDPGATNPNNVTGVFEWQDAFGPATPGEFHFDLKSEGVHRDARQQQQRTKFPGFGDDSDADVFDVFGPSNKAASPPLACPPAQSSAAPDAASVFAPVSLDAFEHHSQRMPQQQQQQQPEEFLTVPVSQLHAMQSELQKLTQERDEFQALIKDFEDVARMHRASALAGVPSFPSSGAAAPNAESQGGNGVNTSTEVAQRDVALLRLTEYNNQLILELARTKSERDGCLKQLLQSKMLLAEQTGALEVATKSAVKLKNALRESAVRLSALELSLYSEAADGLSQLTRSGAGKDGIITALENRGVLRDIDAICDRNFSSGQTSKSIATNITAVDREKELVEKIAHVVSMVKARVQMSFSSKLEDRVESVRDDSVTDAGVLFGSRMQSSDSSRSGVGLLGINTSGSPRESSGKDMSAILPAPVDELSPNTAAAVAYSSSQQRIVRESKFRHVFSNSPRPEVCYQNIRFSTITGDQNLIKVNPSYFVAGIQGGGGPFTAIPLARAGRFGADVPVFNGHSHPVTDFDFSPFDDSIVATSSEDQTVGIWRLPEPSSITISNPGPVCLLKGHERKVTLVKFNPTTEGLLASVSADNTIRLWDVNMGAGRRVDPSIMGGADIDNFTHEGAIYDLIWTSGGVTFITAGKDKTKQIRLIDPRIGLTHGQIIECAHEGNKCVRLATLGNGDIESYPGLFLTVGSDKMSYRQCKIWDPRKLSSELCKLGIDSGSGTLMPFYDPDTSLLYLAGKGDGNIRFLEVAKGGGAIFPISDIKTTVPSRGVAFLPKRGVNVTECEIARLYKLTTNSVDPFSIFVPRKSGDFHSDLYPDTLSPTPTMDIDQWRYFEDKRSRYVPTRVSLRRAGFSR